MLESAYPGCHRRVTGFVAIMKIRLVLEEFED